MHLGTRRFELGQALRCQHPERQKRRPEVVSGRFLMPTGRLELVFRGQFVMESEAPEERVVDAGAHIVTKASRLAPESDRRCYDSRATLGDLAMRRSLLCFGPAVLLALSPLGASADDVYLKNGKSFRDVIATEDGAQVRVKMPGGELAISRAQVLRIERGTSPYGEYLARKSALGKAPSAEAWLGLALWAQGQGLDSGVREAALKAAKLDPGLQGLPPLMRRLDYVLESDLGRWIPYEESMHRKGLVHDGSQWITVKELQARERAFEEERSRKIAARETEARDRLTRQLELSLLNATLERQEAARAAVSAPVLLPAAPVYYPWPLVYAPTPIPQPPQPRTGPQPASPSPTPVPGSLPPSRPGNRFTRIPGSLLPDDGG